MNDDVIDEIIKAKVYLNLEIDKESSIVKSDLELIG